MLVKKVALLHQRLKKLWKLGYKWQDSRTEQLIYRQSTWSKMLTPPEWKTQPPLIFLGQRFQPRVPVLWAQHQLQGWGSFTLVSEGMMERWAPGWLLPGLQFPHSATSLVQLELEGTPASLGLHILCWGINKFMRWIVCSLFGFGVYKTFVMFKLLFPCVFLFHWG